MPPPELEMRLNEYLDEIEKDKSIAFFYANYSNPITGDDYKSFGARMRYLLLGAGLVKSSAMLPKYQIPKDLLRQVRSRRGMKNMPERAWQFQVSLQPEITFVLPYQEYLDWIDEEDDQSEKNKKWKKLEEISIPIEDNTIIPNFKYVSMHLTHDKSIYLIYRIKKSLMKMKQHDVVDYEQIKVIENKINKLLEIAWNERGQYPGFNNVLYVILKNDFNKSELKEVINSFREYILNNFGSIEKFFEKTEREKITKNITGKIRKALRIINRKINRIHFYSLFDLSIKQFENIEELMSRVGFETVKKNPYLILENYFYDWEDSWNVDESDYGINLFQIDIALIPDLEYADWDTRFDAQSPERLRAVVTKILYDAANLEGHSCLEREEIVHRIEEYPLYYISDKLKINVFKLSEYQKQPIFKNKFIMKENVLEDKTVYQLKELREIENIIENFLKKMLKKKHKIKEEYIEPIIKEENGIFKEKLDIDERKTLYYNSLSNGFFVISGKAGSGKTTAVVNLIRKLKEDRKLPIYVFTPTGKANLVIRDRLKRFDLHKESNIRVSTIHRFLYGELYNYIRFASRRDEIFRLVNLISKVLNGKWELLEELKALAGRWRFNPKVIIIDEASMVDEVLLATLFLLVNSDRLEHLIFVGDEKQLPPIGVGRPLVDVIYHLNKNWLEKNIIHLESNLRFDPVSRLGGLSELFSGKDRPSPIEIEEILNQPDKSLEMNYFSNVGELEDVTKNILSHIGCSIEDASIFDMFTDIFENEDELYLDMLQIISPRRVGRFGSWTFNRNVVLDGEVRFLPKSKLICEENIYFTSNRKRILGLANGSIGYIQKERYIHFDDIQELIEDYGWDDVYEGLIKKLQDDIYNPLKSEKIIDFGYAITVHKAQGSDFEHVMLILSEISPFITKELIYTAFTRPRTKLHLIIHKNLKDELPLMISNIYDNSEVEHRNTLLFGYKTSPFRPYLLTVKDGRVLEVKSKIEYMIAKTLDEMDIEFEYEPRDFIQEYHVKPDFKLFVDDNFYYMEHLGIMKRIGYRERWFEKLEIYKKIGILEKLITTSEERTGKSLEDNIKKIIEDIKSNKIKKTEGGFSNHHYYI